MNHGPLIQWLCRIALLSAMILLLGSAQPAHAQPPSSAFLGSPYYLRTAINDGYYGVIGDPFRRYHPGYDYNLRYQPVLAAADGTAIQVRWDNNDPVCNCTPRAQCPTRPTSCSYGLYIKLRHSNNYSTIYGHLSSTAFELNTNFASVTGGTIIGTSGDSGNSSGPHLHFEVDNATGQDIDPYTNGLWKDGEPVGHPIPRPAKSSEYVVDDNTDSTAGFSKGRFGPYNNPCPPLDLPNYCPEWFLAGTGYGGDTWWTYVNGNSPDYWARWDPPITSEDNYEVFVHIPPDHATSWQAPFRVGYTAGEARGVINQNELGYSAENEWVSLAIYRMTPGNYIYTTDGSGEGVDFHCGTGQLCELGADAIKLEGRSTVYQSQWRGDQTWVRNLPLTSSGPQWNLTSSWVGSGGSSIGYLPGSFSLQTESMYVIGNTLWHSIWRNNQGYSRTIPILYGQVQWSNASNWSAPLSISVLAGTPGTDMQSQSDYRIGNTLWQSYWRGNQTWSRTVPIVINVIQWTQATAWSGGYGLSVLAGSGDVQAQTDHVIGSTLHQFYWRSNVGWYRPVQIVNGVPQWTSAPGWEPAPAGDLGGSSGSLQTRADFVLP